MAAYQVLIDQNLQDLNPILVGSASASSDNWRTASMNHYCRRLKFDSKTEN